MMSSSNTSVALPSEHLNEGADQMTTSNAIPSIPAQHQSRGSLHGPVAILWDIENCPVPSDVRSEDVAGNIRMALRVHPVIDGAVTMFSAYGDFNAFPRRLREGCQRTGVKLVDVPNGRKDAADKAILVDMFLFALDNHPPSSIMLISGDVDFAPALHILGQRGYTVILVIPSGSGVSSALSNAGRFVWDWSSVARGEGFVPPVKALKPPGPGPAEVTGLLMRCQVNDVDGQNEEESIVYRGISRGYSNTREVSVVSQSLSEYSSTSVSVLKHQNPTTARSDSSPSGFNEVSTGTPASCVQNDLMWVQPGDLNGLKGQLVKLLELSGGNLPLTRLPAEYQKMYGRPLYVSEYGAVKLVNLLKKMIDAIAVEGKGHRKIVCLRNSKPESVGPTVILARQEKKGKVAQEDNIDIMTVAGSSDELSDEERIAIEENGGKMGGGEKFNFEMTDDQQIINNLKKFRYELQEILVSYSYQILLGCFEAIYLQRYKRQLDYSNFGVNHLEELLEMVRDVVVVQEEPDCVFSDNLNALWLPVDVQASYNIHFKAATGELHSSERLLIVIDIRYSKCLSYYWTLHFIKFTVELSALPSQSKHAAWLKETWCCEGK
ncbi:putative endonuclease or glycosyl hydrolase [Perilla frutescens var. hirtella]|uniref:Endonuclease or glycosyl hydrolase n=1 Tax=Perilla frutescens var. hirtella TaxID=608512 RepID=A0AAD4J3G8_PERFH|nr:putative endonuclease or glycosyl hydrolase [Perilla frutescens var. hirtella]